MNCVPFYTKLVFNWVIKITIWSFLYVNVLFNFQDNDWMDPVKDDSQELWVLLSPDVCDNTKSDHPMWQEKILQHISFFLLHPFSIILFLCSHSSPSGDIPSSLWGFRSSQWMWPHPEPLLYPSSDWSLHPGASMGPWDLTWLVLFFPFAESRCFGADWKHILYIWFKTIFESIKSTLFILSPDSFLVSSRNLGPKLLSAKCDESSRLCLWWRGKHTASACAHIHACRHTCVHMSTASTNLHLCLRHSRSEMDGVSRPNSHSPERLCLSFMNTQPLAPKSLSPNFYPLKSHCGLFSDSTRVAAVFHWSHLSSWVTACEDKDRDGAANLLRCSFLPQPVRHTWSVGRSWPSTHTHTHTPLPPPALKATLNKDLEKKHLLVFHHIWGLPHVLSLWRQRG